MTEYFLDTPLTFGKYNGYTVTQIFQYDPGYIEWLIKFIPDFYIDLESLKYLSPTPCSSPRNINRFNSFFNRGMLNNIYNDNYVQKGLQFTSSGHILEEDPYIFSEESMEILRLKEEGTYTPPDWERPEFN